MTVFVSLVLRIKEFRSVRKPSYLHVLDISYDLIYRIQGLNYLGYI